MIRSSRSWFLVLACLLVLLSGAPAWAEPRVALVIGNAHYGGNLGTLPNTLADARLMAETLQKAGFSVIEVEDADKKRMKAAIAQFGDKLTESGAASTGLFFYAGHAVQLTSRNFLIPVNANITRVTDVDFAAVSAEDIISQMEFAGSAINILMLDASRNNPLVRGSRAYDFGLADISTRYPGMFISFSTAPGATVHDGKGTHSPYVDAVAAAMLTPGQNIHELFDRVRVKVLEATGGKQVTWDSSSLLAPFYFVPATGN